MTEESLPLEKSGDVSGTTPPPNANKPSTKESASQVCNKAAGESLSTTDDISDRLAKHIRNKR